MRATDSEMLSWMISNEGRIHWSRDGDMCTLIWEAADELYHSKPFDEPRDAIEAAMFGHTKDVVARIEPLLW